jgi:hypothetical protein
MAMNGKLTCFIPFGTKEETEITIGELKKSTLVSKIYVVNGDAEMQEEGVEILASEPLTYGETIHAIAEKADSEYVFIYTKTSALTLGQLALDRFLKVAKDTKSGLVYSNYRAIKEGVAEICPLIDYQEGSLRDDFNFGSVLFYDAKVLKEAVKDVDLTFRHAGLYELRLAVAARAEIMRIPEVLYAEEELDTRKSGEKIFDYVDPKNRMVQIEMEIACTEHLKRIGAYLAPNFEKIAFDEGDFKVEATVVIPVRDRVRTIEDAIKSVLAQKANVAFNLIIVDNYSTDGTTEIIEKYAAMDDRLIHIIPERKDLGIGGCWNEAVAHEACGKFAIQLDSDDLYANESTIQKVVDAFYRENCAMVVGSYQMVNFALEEIPPGMIDHKEWTPENGRNNALRINGLGAPRAFYTPVLRQNPIPNVNYGEDYALGLAISRNYQIGRIYDSIYLCRRWDDNSDASLDIEKMNGYNTYKDRIRTIELKARKLM